MLKALVVSDLLNIGATLANICTWLVQIIHGPESNALCSALVLNLQYDVICSGEKKQLAFQQLVDERLCCCT